MTTTCLTVFLASPILAADAPVPAAVHAPLNNISPGCHQAAWLPYRENEKYVRSSPAGVKVSLHNRLGKGLLATIVNTDPKACQVLREKEKDDETDTAGLDRAQPIRGFLRSGLATDRKIFK
jgi:hypothetical protein